jgi:hypothetical protein
MNPALKSLDSPDTPGGDLHAFKPDDPNRFGLSVTATIGPAGEQGGDLFTFTVCSADWLATQSLPKGFAFQRHTLLLERWDPDLVERAVADLCRRTSGNDWDEIAHKLSRYGYWEFEDYRPTSNLPLTNGAQPESQGGQFSTGATGSILNRP